MTPSDKEVVTSNVGWINVPGQNVTYNFTELLNNNYTYYQFQVGHSGHLYVSSWKKQIFSSYVYYFGRKVS